MPAVLESAVPLPAASKSYWSSSCRSKLPTPRSTSPVEMSSETLPPYMSSLHETSLPPHDMSGLPSSGWYGPALPVTDCSKIESGYGAFAYDQSYITPHTSSLTSFSPPTEFSRPPENAMAFAKASPLQPFSPVSEPPSNEIHRMSDTSAPRSSDPSYLYGLVPTDPSVPARPRSSPSTFSPTNPAGGPVDYSWTLNPLGISAPIQHDSFYSNATYPPVRARTPRLSESCLSPVSEIAAPQPRRSYAPIAPHPVGKLGPPKRSREDDDTPETHKRRKRSESTNTLSHDLNEEDRLLIQLKDEENMPWKDIAARFQSDLKKTYQIPALQMRLKRLRERMRVWTEGDVKALRLAHDYWINSKFEIISQKMLELGASEKWTARQCARKWAEIDPAPTPYTSYDHHPTPSYATYTMSPVEAGGPFLPFLHIP